MRGSRGLIKNIVIPIIPNRQLFIASTIILGNFVFGREARLADMMEEGEIYNNLEDYELKKKQAIDDRIRVLTDTRPIKPNYNGHIPLYQYERYLLLLISGLRAYFHPENGYNIVQLGEATAFPCFLKNLERTMLSDKTGRRILRDRPNISSETLNMDRLANMPKNTLGYTYYMWLNSENVSPDTRAPVKYIDNPTHAFIFERYRQCHDFYHAINNLPITIEGEITVKALEAVNMGVPMAALGTLLAPIRLKKIQKERLYGTYLPWAIKTGLNCKPLINVFWEEILNKDIQEIRKELGINPPPNLRAMRKERAHQIQQLKLKYKT